MIDCTHDNETPNQKRTAVDALPNAALVAMASCAIGSTRGYDELVPKHINVVTETKLYRAISPNDNIGILSVKKILNNLHKEMAQLNFNEVHVHQVENLITVQRHNHHTHKAVFMIAHTAFYSSQPPLSYRASVVRIPAKVESVVVAARLQVPDVLKKITEEDAGEFITGYNSDLLSGTDVKGIYSFFFALPLPLFPMQKMIDWRLSGTSIIRYSGIKPHSF